MFIAELISAQQTRTIKINVGENDPQRGNGPEAVDGVQRICRQRRLENRPKILLNGESFPETFSKPRLLCFDRSLEFTELYLQHRFFLRIDTHRD